MINEILGWSGNFCFFWGIIAFSNKHISAWYAQIIANAFYVIQSYNIKNWPLFWLSVILIFMNLYGLIKWLRTNKVTNVTLTKQCKNHAEHHYLTEVMKMYDNDI